MKTYLLDLDGTMYHGSKIINEAKLFIDYLNENNLPYYFLTNNASRTKVQNAKHMLDMGYEGIKPEQFYTSSMAAAAYVRNNFSGNKVYYIGEDGLKEALLEQGFELSEDDVDFVFVGLQRNATYEDYSKALSFLLKGAKLIGTNVDRLLASENGFKIGNGSIVKMFENACGQESPKIGKPYMPILEGCLEYIGKNKDKVIMVGDNLETDVLLGINGGLETVFVTSGVHQVEDIEKLGIVPSKTVNNLLDLIKK